jgi:hypothetical protein
MLARIERPAPSDGRAASAGTIINANWIVIENCLECYCRPVHPAFHQTHRHEWISRAGACLLGEPQRTSRRSRRHTVHCAQHDLSLFVAVAQQVLRNARGSALGFTIGVAGLDRHRTNGTEQERPLRAAWRTPLRTAGLWRPQISFPKTRGHGVCAVGIVSLGYGDWNRWTASSLVSP